MAERQTSGRLPQTTAIQLAAPAGYQLPSTLFWGAWVPASNLTVTLTGFAPAPILSERHGRNWFLLSIVESGEGGLPSYSLVHQNDAATGVAFRGYLPEAGLMSWSSPMEVLGSWQSAARARESGAFSAAIVSEDRIELHTDALGIGPLYYRLLATGVAFSTHPRLLIGPADEPDMVCTDFLLSHGYAGQDRGLALGVQRLPPGRSLVASGPSPSPQLPRSHDLEQFAEPAGPINPERVEQVKAALDRSLARVISAGDAALVLPLSGGWDSRRLFGQLRGNGATPALLSVRTWAHGQRLDAQAAALLAAHEGLPLMAVELATGKHRRRDDLSRQRKVAGETIDHTWALRLSDVYPHRRNVLIDGLGGDVLGQTGFERAELFDPRVGRGALLRHLLRRPTSRVLQEGAWPTHRARNEAIEQWLSWLPCGRNLADLAFLYLRTRRSTALCFQSLPPSHVVTATPYLDLNHLRAALAIDPMDRLSESLQRRILRTYYPELYGVVSTRTVPLADRRASPRASDVAEAIRQLPEAAWQELRRVAVEYLTPEARLKLWSLRHSRALAHRWNWWVRPFLQWRAEVDSWKTGGLHIVPRELPAQPGIGLGGP